MVFHFDFMIFTFIYFDRLSGKEREILLKCLIHCEKGTLMLCSSTKNYEIPFYICRYSICRFQRRLILLWFFSLFIYIYHFTRKLIIWNSWPSWCWCMSLCTLYGFHFDIWSKGKWVTQWIINKIQWIHSNTINRNSVDWIKSKGFFCC